MTSGRIILQFHDAVMEPSQFHESDLSRHGPNHRTSNALSNSRPPAAIIQWTGQSASHWLSTATGYHMGFSWTSPYPPRWTMWRSINWCSILTPSSDGDQGLHMVQHGGPTKWPLISYCGDILYVKAVRKEAAMKQDDLMRQSFLFMIIVPWLRCAILTIILWYLFSFSRDMFSHYLCSHIRSLFEILIFYLSMFLILWGSILPRKIQHTRATVGILEKTYVR